MDWAPKESLVTPLALYCVSFSSEIVSGLHSTVTSAPSAIPTPSRIASMSRARNSAGRSDGVPPPKNTEVAGPASAGRTNRVLVSADRTGKAGDLGATRGHVALPEVVPVRPGGERAVVTTATAKRMWT